MKAATEICKRHYNFKDARSCELCPISSECRSGCGAGREALREWQERVEAKAIEVSARPLMEAQIGGPCRPGNAGDL